MALPRENRPASLLDSDKFRPPSQPPLLPRIRGRPRLVALKSFVRRHKKALIGAAVGLVVVTGAGAWLAINGAPELELLEDLGDVVSKPTLAELIKKANAEPKNAGLQVDLGDAQFEAGKRGAGVRSYDRGLSLDRTATSGKLIDNLVACTGKKEQGAAHTLLVKYKLTEASAELRKFTSNGSASTRNAVLQTLKGLDRATDTDFLTVWTLDLKSGECEVKKRAVEKLGSLGDKRALDDIRAARKKDKEETPWYGFHCLTGAADDAEKKILARK
jgi:hypothetical protein